MPVPEAVRERQQPEEVVFRVEILPEAADCVPELTPVHRSDTVEARPQKVLQRTAARIRPEALGRRFLATTTLVLIPAAAREDRGIRVRRDEGAHRG
jgi:hypothetical protein